MRMLGHIVKFLTTMPRWEARHDEAAHISRRRIDDHQRGKSRRAIGNGASGRSRTG
jgi:hypothetical protein